MSTWVWIVVAVGAAILLLVGLRQAFAHRWTRHLRDRFGPEYDRTVESAASKRDAEADLAEREQRHDEREIRPPSTAARERYIVSWQQTQTQFVDDPTAAVGAAESLIESVMAERGYPVEDFDQRADDLSVDYPEIVENYRQARHLASQGETEDLRRAMRHQRKLFEQLVSDDPARHSLTRRYAASAALDQLDAVVVWLLSYIEYTTRGGRGHCQASLRQLTGTYASRVSAAVRGSRSSLQRCSNVVPAVAVGQVPRKPLRTHFLAS